MSTQPPTPLAIDWATVPETFVHGAIGRRSVTGDRFTVVRYAFPAGAVFPWHQHPESQATFVVSGRFTFDWGDRRQEYGAGEIVVIPGGVGHEGRADNGPVEIVCVLTPARVSA